jgi:magnesium chelatase subunit H
MQKHISAAEIAPVNVVIVTLDKHLAPAVERARAALRRDIPGINLSLHAASDWAESPDALEACRADIAKGHIIIVTMMFLDEHIQAILPDLQGRRDHCDAMVACMSAGEVMRLTRMGRFTMGGEPSGAVKLLKRLRGSSDKKKSSGAGQMAMLRRLPRILKFIPGTAQDVRAYFLTMQYWLACSDDNLANMVRQLIDRYADGARLALRGTLDVQAPVVYPEAGVYHPKMVGRVAERAEELPESTGERGTVGVLLMRSYILSRDTAHYDGVIHSLEARGFRVIPAFASGLDSRPAIERFFMENGAPVVDAVVSLTGFSLVGGPAYNDTDAAQEMLEKLNVPYTAAHAMEFQTLQQWGGSDRGLMPVETTMMVAIPELDGATSPLVYGGRADTSGAPCEGCERHCRFESQDGVAAMQVCVARSEQLASRVERMVRLRKTPREERKLAIVLFNFPPNGGATGTAAYLSVFESLHNTLKSLKQAVRQGLYRRPARLRLRGRSDAPAVREGLRADPRLLRLLPLPARGLRRQRGAAFRHPRRAGVHAGQAVGPEQHVLAGPPDRRPAEHLPLCGEQPVRRHDRQAALGGHAGQLPDAAGGACRPLSRATGSEKLHRTVARPAPRRRAGAPGAGRSHSVAGGRTRNGRGRAGLDRRRA